MSDKQAIRNVLQQGYGDATQTVLDDRVAGLVLHALRDRGWFSAQEVAAIVMAAGGRIEVTDDHLSAIGSYEIVAEKRPETFSVLVRAHKR